MLPTVTILIPIHNGSRTIDRCFQSLQQQTYQDFTILCIDDCSTDNSLEIIEKWQETFGKEKLSIINNRTNLGITKSLNAGLQEINTLYTARIDADDWWHPEKLKKQIDFLRKNTDYGIVGCNYINMNGNAATRITLKKTDSDIKRTIIKRNPFAHSCVVFKTDLIKNAGKYDENVKYGQDYDLWLRCMPLTKFNNIQEFLCYRSTEDGVSVRKQRAQMWQGIKTQVKYIRLYRLSPFHYLYLAELLALILTPDWIKRIKRKFSFS